MYKQKHGNMDQRFELSEIKKQNHNSFPPRTEPTLFLSSRPKRWRSGINSPREESLSLEDACNKEKKGEEGGWWLQ
jgi:hypothetical protein